MLTPLALALIGVCVLRRPAGAASFGSAQWLKCGAAALSGMIIVPAAIISFWEAAIIAIIRHA